jgi:hypothetical protein
MCNLGGGFPSYADDNYACTYAPDLWECPSYKVTLDPKETYYVMVLSMGTCSGDYGDYQITVDTDGDPSLTLVNDDMNAWTTTVTSQGTVHAYVP